CAAPLRPAGGARRAPPAAGGGCVLGARAREGVPPAAAAEATGVAGRRVVALEPARVERDRSEAADAAAVARRRRVDDRGSQEREGGSSDVVDAAAVARRRAVLDRAVGQIERAVVVE